MPTEYVTCRTLRHNWDLIGFYDATGPNGRKFTVMSLLCNLCECTREDFFDSHGNLETRHYGLPDDYAIRRTKEDRREGRIHVQESRAELMGRFTVYKSSSSLERAAKRR